MENVTPLCCWGWRSVSPIDRVWQSTFLSAENAREADNERNLDAEDKRSYGGRAVVRWLRKEGKQVKKGEVLLEVDSNKVTMKKCQANESREP